MGVTALKTRQDSVVRHEWPSWARARASAQTADAQTEAAVPADEGIADVVVTAQRRSESIQNVPITIQALTGESAQAVERGRPSTTTSKFLPNVTGQVSPAQARTTSTCAACPTGVDRKFRVREWSEAFRTSTIYLDDQSGQVPGRNLDIYAADLERIEVLEGPQGTLFGAGAQAGVVRYITNKPKLDRVEADFSCEHSHHGAR